MVDQIADPLVHMVRYLVEHGIESSVGERRSLGKPDAGHVTLRAYHKSGSIVIEIQWDGRGLDRDHILEKTKEKGLVRDGDSLTDNETDNLVFEPGFSTTMVVSDVFGQAEMLSVSEGLIPLYRLHHLFNIGDAQTDPQQAVVVIVEHRGREFGLLVDDLLGQQQIVIKSLGESLKNTECIAGGAIMPDGRVGLILDIDSLVKTANRNQPPTQQAA